MSTRPPLIDLAPAAKRLLTSLHRTPSGQVSNSVYETGRIVSLAPWLGGHEARLRFLASAQHADGSWGGPDGYALVPTLSAVEALLADLARAPATAAAAVPRVDIVDRGLARLRAWLATPPSIPDLPAVELIAPGLIESINDLQVRTETPALVRRAPGVPLAHPSGMSADGVRAIRARLAAGGGLPEKLLHALEVAGPEACHASSVRPGKSGVGASPAATAAWLGTHPPDVRDPSRRYLEAIVERTGGPVPCATPITVFERAWVLADLARSRLQRRPPRRLIASLDSALGTRGTPAGDGLPPDADSTAVALFVLAQYRSPRDPLCLREYETPSHFCSWPGEQGASTSVNAHVLEALGSHGAPANAGGWPEAAAAKVVAWLHDQQHPDGHWRDRWHASPYYATACCAVALDRFGGPGSTEAVRRAVGWVLRTQRADGSWGLWDGTLEETAYAVQVLASTDGWSAEGEAEEAALRGYLVLSAGLGAPIGDAADHPPLWHDKDLYAPAAIISAAMLAAVHSAQRHPRLIGRMQRSSSIEPTSRTG